MYYLSIFFFFSFFLPPGRFGIGEASIFRGGGFIDTRAEEGVGISKIKQKQKQKRRKLTSLRSDDSVQRMKPMGDRDYMSDTSVAFTIVGGWVMVAEVSEIADDPLVEISKLLLRESISIEACGIWATFEERLNLVAL